MALPNDSDESTLDEIAATGKALTLGEAVELAFRYQPRLRAQLETIAQARGRSRLFFRRSYRPWLRITTWNIVWGRWQIGSVGEGPPGIELPAWIGSATHWS